MAAAAGMTWHTLSAKPDLDTPPALTASERHAAHVPASTGKARPLARSVGEAGGPQAELSPPAASHQEIIQQLLDAAVTYDPTQLPLIQPYLVDADPVLRTAAVNAVVVMGEASGASMLRNAAKLLASADEAKAYERKAAYLELPPASSEELGSKFDGSASE